MSKILIFITVFFLLAIGYVLLQPRREKSVVKLPDIISQPTAVPTPDYSSIKTEDISIGTGDEAIEGKKVSVLYTGMLTDGTVFDASVDHNNEPLTFTIGAGQMIQGFDQGARGMKVGGKRKITIPPQFGYGERSPSAKIPANSTLVFEVTLEKVE